MKKSIFQSLGLLSVATLLTTIGHAQNLYLNGAVETNEGKKVEGIRIVASESGEKTFSDYKGQFALKQLSKNGFTIQLWTNDSLLMQHHFDGTISDTMYYTFKLGIGSRQLDDVIVHTSSKRLAIETDDLAKVSIKNLENPEVYSLVSKELMQDANVVNMQDALRNVAGATVNMDPAGGISIMSRGFSTYVGARNGYPFIATSRSNSDLANVEAIEVLKGPSGALFGNAINSYGGLVNLVTKKPFDYAHTEIGYTLGTYGLQRLTADVNTPITDDKKVLLRVNAAAHKQGSFMTAGHNNRFFAAPSVTYKVSDRLKLNLDIELYKEDVTRPYYISSYAALGTITSLKDLPINYKEAFFDNSLNAVSSNVRTYLNASYKISNNWISETNISSVNENLQKSYQGYLTFLSGGRMMRRVGDFGPITTYVTDLQQNFKGDFKVGSIRNRLLIGFDYFSNNTKRVYVTYPVLDTITYTGTYQLANVRSLDKAYANYSGLKATSYNYNYNQVAIYASDLINVTKALMLMASARVDRYMLKGSTGYNQNSVTPKFGIVYQPIQDIVSIFGNYTSGYTNAGVVTQPDGTSVTLKPYFAHQWESGVKLSLLHNRLITTASYFDIRISDAPLYASTGYVTQDGKQKSNGAEVNLLVNAVDGLSITSGYVYNINKYIKASSNEGKFTVATPKNVANIWASYRFIKLKALQNFGIGAGMNYVDKSYFDAANTVIIPSYLLVNASVFYDTPSWRIGVAGGNLTNRKYWSSIATPQPLRNISLSVNFKF